MNSIASLEKRRSIVAFFFIVTSVLMLTGFLPEYLEYLGTDCIELSENIEDESQEEKNENESDKYHEQVTFQSIYRSKKLYSPSGYFHKWQHPSVGIITPPPEYYLVVTYS